jgi:hypothetical protein
MLRLFFVPGLVFCRHRPEAVAAFFHALRNGSGSLAKLAAMRRASSCVSDFAAVSPPRLILEIKGPPFNGPTGNRALCAVTSVTQQSYDAN